MPKSVTAESATADTYIYTCVVVHSIRRGSRHEKAWKGNLPWQRESQYGRQGKATQQPQDVHRQWVGWMGGAQEGRWQAWGRMDRQSDCGHAGHGDGWQGRGPTQGAVEGAKRWP